MARTTDNLRLTIPDAGEPAEQWVQEISDTFDAIDAHDHTTGKKITQEALDLRGAVTLQGNPLNATSSVQLQPQSAPPLGSGRLYVDGAGNLYFRTAADIPVQITSAVGVAGSGGSIGGDYAASGASLTYDSAAKTYRLLDQNGASAAVIVGNAAATQLSLADTSPSAMRTLATVGGELYYRDASNRTYPLTNNGHAAGGDIRGDYQTTTAAITYNNSNKTYSFTVPSGTAKLATSAVAASSFVYPSNVTRRLYASPASGMRSGTVAPSPGPFTVPASDQVAYSLPVPRGALGSQLLAVGVDFRSSAGTPTATIDVSWWPGGPVAAAFQTFSSQSYTYPTYTVQGSPSSSVSLLANASVDLRFNNNAASPLVFVYSVWADYSVADADAWAT